MQSGASVAETPTPTSVYHIATASDSPTSNDLNSIQNVRSSQVSMLSGAFKRRYADARKDWNQLISSGALFHDRRGKCRRSSSDIRMAVTLILSSDNVQYMSWGVKSMTMMDGKKIDIPALCRKRGPEEIYRHYRNLCSNGATVQRPLSRSVFLQVLNLITKRQQNRKSAVDYVLGTLYYDTMILLREIVRDLIDLGPERDALLKRIDAIEEFLKFTYMEHVGKDSDGFHDITHALSSSEPQPVSCKV